MPPPPASAALPTKRQLKAQDFDRLYTWEEIGKHTKMDDCWIVIDKSVYDVTQWIPRHPGGEIILQGSGGDCSGVFRSYHPDYVEEKLLSKFRIGRVASNDRYVDGHEGEFSKVLYKRANALIEKEGLRDRNKKGLIFGTDPNVLKKTGVLVLIWILSFIWGDIYGSYIGAFMLGTAHALMMIGIMHEAVHAAYSHSKWMNKLMSFSASMVGIHEKSYCWHHVFNHHVYTSVQGLDTDINLMWPFMRTNKYQPLYWFHKYQAYYAPILYAFVGPMEFFNDFVYLFQGFFKLSKAEVCGMFVMKTFSFFHMFVLPFLLHSAGTATIILLLKITALGFALALINNVNHLTIEATFFKGPLTNDWAMNQILSSCNFSETSWLANYFCGGVNYQIEHHLFPSISHIHYPKVAKVVKQTCAEFNVPYVSYPTFWSGICSHFQLLCVMGR